LDAFSCAGPLSHNSGFVKNLVCDVAAISFVSEEVFILEFPWYGTAPKAGQFFMIKPLRSSVFLGRPISVFEYNTLKNTAKFLIAKRGTGTKELSDIKTGDLARLTGPLGNAWEDFLPAGGKVALVGGGVGIAPLAALVAEKPDCNFHFYAGFRNGFRDKQKENAMLAGALNAKKLVVAAEDGVNAQKGRITDFLSEPENYDAVFACGPTPMLKAVVKWRGSTSVPCYVSLERRMACGAGACLGCTVRTVHGNRRCCADGPVFPAGEVLFDE